MILDTSFLVDVLRGDRSVAEAVGSIGTSGPAKVAAPSVMELWEGIHLATSTESERAAVVELLAELREVTFGRKCAVQAGATSARLQQAGAHVGDADVMVAATAMVEGEPVVTANTEHFDRIEGVEVVEY